MTHMFNKISIMDNWSSVKADTNWRSTGPATPRYFTNNCAKKGGNFEPQGIVFPIQHHLLTFQNSADMAKTLNDHFIKPQQPKFKTHFVSQNRVDFFPDFARRISNIITMDFMQADKNKCTDFINPGSCSNKQTSSVNAETPKEISLSCNKPQAHIEEEIDNKLASSSSTLNTPSMISELSNNCQLDQSHSEDSFIICFGDTTPEECFVFDDSSISKPSQSTHLSECESDDFIQFETSNDTVDDSTFSDSSYFTDSNSDTDTESDEESESKSNMNTNGNTKCFGVHDSKVINNSEIKECDITDGCSQPRCKYNPQKPEDIIEKPIANKKKVSFDLKPKVHHMNTWSFAYRQARKGGHWEEVARDRVRFQNRVHNLKAALEPILNSKHRDKIYNARFKKSD